MQAQGSIHGHIEEVVLRRRFRGGASIQLSFAALWPVGKPNERRKRLSSPARPTREPPPQFVLDLAGYSITQLMVDIERILRRIAVARSPMPNNPVLGTLAGNRGRSSASRALERLEKAGRIKIEKELRRRRVRFPDNACTGWGEARPGHKPYSSNAKGAARKPKQRADNSPPMPACVPPRSPIEMVGSAILCQWPMWEEGETPNDHYCGKLSQRGRSWCVEHTMLVYGKPLGPKLTCA